MQKLGDLRTWIEEVRETGLLKEVRGADAHLEIGAISELNAKRKRYTLLFDEIKGYRKGFRILTGVLHDAQRVALTFGLPKPSHDLDLVMRLKEKLKQVEKAMEYEPEYVTSSPLLENTKSGNEVNILQFPAPKWHELNGGCYIGTGAAVITRDPDDGWINVGTYRIMVHNERELGILLGGGRHARLHVEKYLERKEPCPVAISFGHHPLMFALGGIEVPPYISEYNYAGALIKSRWKVIKGPITGLPIPADSEIAIEGFLLPEFRDEGPFGEFVGYYAGGVFKNPVIKIEAIYYRDNPIILGAPPAKPPYDYSYYRCPLRAAIIWDMLEKAGIVNIKGVWCHEAGYSRAFNVISIKQAYAGHAKQVAHVAAQCAAGAPWGKYVIIVDDDIDPTNLFEVIWAICSRTNPVKAIEFIEGTWTNQLDPSVERTSDMRVDECVSSIALIYACWPYSWLVRGEIPKVVEASPQLREAILKKWKEIFES